MDAQDLQNRFTYHPPKGDEIKKYTDIRGHAYLLAVTINELCPDSREKSVAITKLEEVVMWANTAIARNGG